MLDANVMDMRRDPLSMLVMPDEQLSCGDWCGYITVQNIEQVMAKLEAYLRGSRYSRIFLINGEGNLKTSLELTPNTATEKAFSIHHESTHSWVTVSDTYSVWFLETSAESRKAATFPMQPYIQFNNRQIHIVHYGRVGSRKLDDQMVYQCWFALERTLA